MRAVWEDVVYRNLYITGGIGSSGSNEGFSVDYDLPNTHAYCETCASVGMVFWNQRMNRLSGDSKFIDVLERSLYNGALSGLSLSGDRFFYGNPLASFGSYARREWFGTACCPSNIARLTASVGDYIYATSTTALYVNLFISNTAAIKLNKQIVPVQLTTNYPWNGAGELILNPEKRSIFELHIRIPGWVTGKPVPGDLYAFKKNQPVNITFLVNEKEVLPEIKNGYAIIKRTWRKDDKVKWNFPMEVRELVAHDAVTQNHDRLALQRGPLVYCVEGADNGGKAWDFIVPENTKYKTEFKPELLGGVVTISFEAQAIKGGETPTSVTHFPKTITAIPYYAWSNRGANEMQVWLPKKVKEVRINPEN
jgi:DUF1680 family protein